VKYDMFGDQTFHLPLLELETLPFKREKTLSSWPTKRCAFSACSPSGSSILLILFPPLDL
jgi:hypothetical protein